MPGGQSGLPQRSQADAGPASGGLEWQKFSPKNRKYTYEPFDGLPSFQARTGNGAATGATGNINLIRTQYGCYEYVILGAGQTIIVPVYDVTTGLGLDFAQDQTNTEGHETSFSPNIVTSGGGRGKHGYVIGGSSGETRPFFAQFTFRPVDSSGIAEGFFGFIQMGAYQTAVASYNEYAGLSLVGSGASAQIRIKTRLNGGSAGNVDTTQTVGDGISVTLRVEVDPVTRLARFKYGASLTQAQIDSGAVPFPTVTKTDFAFTSGVVVRPAFFFLNSADLVDNLYYQNFQCGFIPQRGV
jgi:hypothetical protein